MNNESLQNLYIRADRVILVITGLLFVVSLTLAPLYDTWVAAIVIGGGTLAATFAVSKLAPGAVVSRIMIGAGLMVMTSLHIHQAHGMIEFHFGVFLLLAVLLYYRDWIPVVAAAATIAVHHFGFFFLQSSGSNIWILPTTESGIGIIFLHAAYVIVETAIIVWMSIDLQKEFLASSELGEATHKIVQGEQIDLSVRTSGKSNLLKEFDGYTETIGELVSKVSASSAAVNDTTSQLVSMSNNLQDQSNGQQQQTDMIASAVEELTASASEVSANAEQAASAANAAYESSQSCRQASTTTESDIRSLDAQISDAAATIGSLDKETSEIGSLLDVIRAIAEQTNLLALNAAIEAARAGDQGRGFAVVADEVRSLAMRTQQSTQEIDQMIEKLQKGSKTAVNAIESSKSLVTTCVSNTHESLALIEQVEQAINHINDMNQFIATSANEQSQVTSDISQNLSEIVGSTAEMNDQINSSRSVVDALNLHAQELEEVKGRFKGV